MALSFFAPESSIGNDSKTFLDEWLTSNLKNRNTQFSITEIKRVQSGKGYLVETEEFLVFLWKNSAISKLLVEALEVYVNQPEKGRALFVVLPQKKVAGVKPQIAADLDVEQTWFTSKNGYTVMEPSVDLAEGISGNPLIPG
jgi:hypothetical protein